MLLYIKLVITRICILDKFSWIVYDNPFNKSFHVEGQVGRIWELLFFLFFSTCYIELYLEAKVCHRVSGASRCLQIPEKINQLIKFLEKRWNQIAWNVHVKIFDQKVSINIEIYYNCNKQITSMYLRVPFEQLIMPLLVKPDIGGQNLVLLIL